MKRYVAYTKRDDSSADWYTTYDSEAGAEIARLRELVADQDDGGHWYSQASMNAMVEERDSFRSTCERLEAENRRLKEVLRNAVEWIEDDRADDEYIIEDWYHEARAALEGGDNAHE
jgi:type II secretory pathway component PulJ